MTDHYADFALVGEAVTVVGAALPDAVDKPITIIADDTWKRQRGERASAYAATALAVSADLLRCARRGHPKPGRSHHVAWLADHP